MLVRLKLASVVEDQNLHPPQICTLCTLRWSQALQEQLWGL